MGWNLVVSSLLEYDGKGKGKGWRCASSVHSISGWREREGEREGESEGESEGRVRGRVRWRG